MKINMEDMRYYLDPVQNPRFNRVERQGVPMTEFTIIPLRYRRPDLNERKANRLGKPMTVTRQRYEQNDIWWIDAEGDHVQGAIMSPRSDNRMLSVGIIDDETFAVGTSGGTFGSSCLLTNARRSDGRVTFLHGSNRTVVGNLMQAASWARDLMPEDGDTQDVVDQKVMLAKQKYGQRYRKGQVYIEGMIRDWLDLLSEVRDDGHDMPAPRFAIGATGIALMGGRSLAADTATAPQQQMIDRMNNLPLRTGGVNSMVQYVGTSFVTVTSATANTYQEMRNASELDSHIQNSIGYVDGVIEQSRFPILTGF